MSRRPAPPVHEKPMPPTGSILPPGVSVRMSHRSPRSPGRRPQHHHLRVRDSDQPEILCKCGAHYRHVFESRHCPLSDVVPDTGIEMLKLIREPATHYNQIRAENMEQAYKAATEYFGFFIDQLIGECIAGAHHRRWSRMSAQASCQTDSKKLQPSRSPDRSTTWRSGWPFSPPAKPCLPLARSTCRFRCRVRSL